jgi:hypothetical protein
VVQGVSVRYYPKDAVDVDDEADEVEEGAVVEAPPVVAGGASGMFSMSQPLEEVKVGPSVRDGDLLVDGEVEEDNVTAAAEGEARLAANGAAAAT